MRTKFAIFVATLVVAASANANLITNGNFEASGSAIPSWTSTGNVATGGVPYFGAGSTAKDSTKLVAFNGGDSTPNGTLSQTFATMAGVNYSVDFDYGVTTGGSQSILAEILGNNGTTILTSFVASSTSTALNHFTFSFAADGSASTLRFIDNLNNPTTSQDGVLDNVSVVPEPGSIALLGLGLLGFAVTRRRAVK